MDWCYAWRRHDIALVFLFCAWIVKEKWGFSENGDTKVGEK